MFHQESVEAQLPLRKLGLGNLTSELDAMRLGDLVQNHDGRTVP